MGKYPHHGQGRQAYSVKNPELRPDGRLECGCKPGEDLSDPQCEGHQAIQALVSHMTEPGATDMDQWAKQRLEHLQQQILLARAALKQAMDQRDLLAIAVVESELAKGSAVGVWLGWSKLVVPSLVRWSRAGFPPLTSTPWREGSPQTVSSRPRGSNVPLGRRGSTPFPPDVRKQKAIEARRKKAARARARRAQGKRA